MLLGMKFKRTLHKARENLYMNRKWGRKIKIKSCNFYFGYENPFSNPYDMIMLFQC